MTDLELRIYTATVRGEAEGEGELGQSAVAWVIRHRVIRRHSSIIEVCFDPLQFSIWNSRSKRRAELLLAENSTHRRIQGICAEVWDGLIPDPTDGADHYHADYVAPSWRHAYRHTVTIGAHLFYDSKREA